MEALNAIAEPHRRKILGLLRQGDRSVLELAAALPMRQPSVSKHLKVLRQAGLVTVHPRGPQRYYRLRLQPLVELDAWLEPYRQVWNARLDDLEAHLDQLAAQEESP